MARSCESCGTKVYSVDIHPDDPPTVIVCSESCAKDISDSIPERWAVGISSPYRD
jgi:hypothetical protein